MSDTPISPTVGAIAYAGIASALTPQSLALGPVAANLGLPGGTRSRLNVVNAQVVKASPGILVKIGVVVGITQNHV